MEGVRDSELKRNKKMLKGMKRADLEQCALMWYLECHEVEADYDEMQAELGRVRSWNRELEQENKMLMEDLKSQMTENRELEQELHNELKEKQNGN